MPSDVLNVGPNGSYALGPQDAPSELSVVNVVPFCSTVYELVPTRFTSNLLPRPSSMIKRISPSGVL